MHPGADFVSDPVSLELDPELFELEPELFELEEPDPPEHFAFGAESLNGNTLSSNEPKRFPETSQYLQTTKTPEIPHPSFVDFFQTT
jgi:hypothetical protein